MKTPEANNNSGGGYGPLDSWTCSKCDKTISASRPPVRIAENCSCSELGAATEGIAQASSNDAPSYTGADIFQHGKKYHIPPTYASSSNSDKAPEGPEKIDPNVSINRSNTWITLSPDTGLNEKQHLRTTSFDEEMPITLQRFLRHEQNDHVFFEGASLQKHNYLRQETFLRPSTSMKAKKGTKGSEFSMESSTTGSGGESFLGWGVDPVTGAGGWIGDYEDGYLQWMSESAFGE